MARAEFRQLGALLKEGGSCRVVLLHGDDPGLVRERGERIVKLVSAGDPLRLTDIPKDASRDVGLLRAEAATAALIGGRRAIRVRDAGDAFLPAVRLALSGTGPGIVILEGTESQNQRGKLRPELDASPLAAVVECAQERGAALEAAIGTLLGELGVAAEPDALGWLAGRLGEDRQLLRRECEKLALYCGAGGRVELVLAMACLGNDGGGDADGVAAAALAGDLGGLDRALDAAFAEGASAVQLLRNAIWQAQRLVSATLAASTSNPAAAIRGLRPAVHPDHREQFERAVRLWDPPALARAGAVLLWAERRAKTTGLPEMTIARNGLISLALMAQRRH